MPEGHVAYNARMLVDEYVYPILGPLLLDGIAKRRYQKETRQRRSSICFFNHSILK